MAKMVPSPMRFTESEAERFLYDRFERELPDDVVVVHGARWVGERHGRRGADGEADFVILDPRRGILSRARQGETLRRFGRGVHRLARPERGPPKSTAVDERERSSDTGAPSRACPTGGSGTCVILSSSPVAAEGGAALGELALSIVTFTGGIRVPPEIEKRGRRSGALEPAAAFD